MEPPRRHSLGWLGPVGFCQLVGGKLTRHYYINDPLKNGIDLHEARDLVGQGLLGLFRGSDFHLLERNPGPVCNLSRFGRLSAQPRLPVGRGQ